MKLRELWVELAAGCKEWRRRRCELGTLSAAVVIPLILVSSYMFLDPSLIGVGIDKINTTCTYRRRYCSVKFFSAENLAEL
jgi:hypothetical protein